MSALTIVSQIQKKFLDELVHKKAPVAVYLKNGIKLKGTLKAFDGQCLLFDHPAQQIVYTDAVSAIVPMVVFETF